MYENAINEKENGVYVNVEVVANSKKFDVSWDPWRQRIKLKITAKAQKGKANEEILSFFSLCGNSRIVSGSLSREKTIFIDKSKEEVMTFLNSAFV